MKLRKGMLCKKCVLFYCKCRKVIDGLCTTMGGFSWRELCYVANRRNFSRLPPELIAHVFTFLPAKDIAVCATVCKTFYEASNVDAVWQKKCQSECSVTMSNSTRCISHKELYTKVLYKYGKLLGLWQIEIGNYGGILQVKFENGYLIGIEWCAPNQLNLSSPLRSSKLFKISLDEGSGRVSSHCIRGCDGERNPAQRHDCHIALKRVDNCYTKCLTPFYHKHPDGNDQEFREWVMNETRSNVGSLSQHIQELLLMKFLMIKQYENAFEHKRIEYPQRIPGAVIQPGLFKGTYGAHGLEIVMLNYEEDGAKVKATKVTGDPNVPAGQVTFKADLRYPLVLTSAQQSTMEVLRRLEATSAPIPPSELPVQPFKVPADCVERYPDTPNMCKARFFGYGQIAGHGYTNPSFIRGHWIVFNEDLFGFLWMELLSLSMFHRVQEALSPN